MNMERWWNGTDRGQMRYSEENFSKWYLVHQKSHVHWSEIEPEN